MKKYVFLLLIIFLGALSGCGSESSLESVEIGTYTHPQAGYSLSVPNDWVKQVEDDVSVAFIGQKPPVVFNIVYEIGGYDYYTMKSLAEEVVDYLGRQFSDLKMEDTPDDKLSSVYQFTANGTLKDGAKVKIYAVLLEPEVGIRYYLLFSVAPGDFNSLQGLFSQVTESFKMIKTKDELYQQMTERGEDT